MHYLDYREDRVHGTVDFTFAFYHIEEGHPRYEMPFHWHREVEIIRILSGSFSCCLDENAVLLRQGDVLFVNPGVIHSGIPSSCVYECVVFDPSALLMQSEACRQTIRLLTGPGTVIQPLFGPDHPVSEAARQLFIHASSALPGRELYLMGALFHLFAALYSEGCYEIRTGARGQGVGRIQALKPVLEFIDRSYMKPVTLETLARLAGMTPRYFCRFFYAFIHRTPIDYLNYYRVERACLLLASPDLTITEIAYRCGFNDSSYFGKVFRKYKGISPKQYQLKNARTPAS